MTWNRRAALAVTAIGVGAVAIAFAVAADGHGERPESHGPGGPKPVRHVGRDSFGRSVTVRQVDRQRGLIFELDGGSPIAGDSLRVKLASDAPRATRDAFMTRPLAATCTVPGHPVHEFAGRWNRRFAQFGTALVVDDPGVSVADDATTCVLHVGREGSTPGTARFDGPPFSRVRMK